MKSPGTTRVFKSKNGWRWRSTAKNGLVVAACVQGYSRRAHAVRMAVKYGPAGFDVIKPG